MKPIALKINILTLKQVIIVILSNIQLLKFKEITPTGVNTANDYTK